MKKSGKIVALACATACALTCSACAEYEFRYEVQIPAVPKIFGTFSYYGKHLYDFAETEINSATAKQLISNQARSSAVSTSAFEIDNPAAIQDFGYITYATALETSAAGIIERFGKCEVTATYYNDESVGNINSIDGVEGINEVKPKVKTTTLLGQELNSYLTANEYAPWGQLNIKYLHVYSELIDELDAENAAYKETEEGKTAPFKNKYSYHKDKYGHFVLYTREYRQIP